MQYSVALPIILIFSKQTLRGGERRLLLLSQKFNEDISFLLSFVHLNYSILL